MEYSVLLLLRFCREVMVIDFFFPMDISFLVYISYTRFYRSTSPPLFLLKLFALTLSQLKNKKKYNSKMTRTSECGGGFDIMLLHFVSLEMLNFDICVRVNGRRKCFIEVKFLHIAN